jgi:hypothetical protein
LLDNHSGSSISRFGFGSNLALIEKNDVILSINRQMNEGTPSFFCNNFALFLNHL